MRDADLTYATGLEFVGVAPLPIEVDFTCWYQRRIILGRNEEPVLIFGEAKSFAAQCFKSEDIERMSKVAEKFPGAFIVFATLKDELSDAEKSSIGQLAMQGRARLENGVRRSRERQTRILRSIKEKPRQTLIQPGFSYQLFIRGLLVKVARV